MKVLIVKGRLESFGLRPGRRIGGSYEVERFLGGGSEGEVYQVRDRTTGLHRAAKIYFPHHDKLNRIPVALARKLDKLRHCPMVLQYLHSTEVKIRGYRALAVISELCAAEPLQTWIDRHRGRRVHPYVALTVFHELVRGIETIHANGEYHSDVDTENIMIEQSGIRFRLKLIDFYEWGKPTKHKMQQDIFGAVHVLYNMIGGKAHYGRSPAEVRYICCNLRTSKILERFPAIAAMRHYTESFEPRTLF